MKVLNLRCGAQHVFEGWFGSEADFQDQHARGLVSCPVCGDAVIEKMLSAPRLNLGGAVAETAAPAPPAGAPTLAPDPQARLWRAMRQAIAQAEDVGERFADEARRMHQGDTEARQIRGRATMQDTLALLEEGVPVLPLPAALKETLQ
ncbi:MAG: DUF1178 family protein [Hydrogenophaga sp.]|nr:DUF1178 family protein [Hydrogenophaga sp.]